MFQMKVAAGYYDHVMTALNKIKSIFDFMSMYIRCFPESKTGELPTMTDTQFSGRLIEKRTQWLLSQDNK